MSVLPSVVRTVINEFSKLPGIGPKSSARMVYHYLRGQKNDASRLAKALLRMDEEIVFCKKCFNVSETEVCSVCSDKLRDRSRLCVVAKPLDVVAFEEAGVYDGMYFVLGGVISPADGIGADELRFNQLKERVKELLDEMRVQPEKNVEKLDDSKKSSDRNIKDPVNIKNNNILEVIVATSPNLEGEATASYIADILREFTDSNSVIISRLAMGLPTGADVEYADRLTLKRALDGRTVTDE